MVNSYKKEVVAGQKNNYLTLIREVESIKVFRKKRKCWERSRMIECRCDCGNLTIIRLSAFKNGNTKSCGCFKIAQIKKAATTHGFSGRHLFKIWKGIKDRCYNRKMQDYPYYGGKGVVVCEEWLNSYEAFERWAIDNGWNSNMHVDKDMKGNGMIYSPDNCMIVTQRDNLKYKGNTIMINFNGRRISLMDLAEEFGINSKTMYHRYYKGWPVDKLIKVVKKIK